MSDEDPHHRRIREALVRAPAGRPDLDRVTRRARAIRTRRYVGGAVVGALIGAGVVLPLQTLSSIGDRSGEVAGTPGPSPTGDALPDVAEVVCDGTAVEVLTPAVRPRPDGVHFRVDNRTGERVSFRVVYPTGAVAGTGVAPGVSDALFGGAVPGWPVPPGTARVSCGLQDGGEAEAPEGTVQVVDEEGLWVSTALDCDRVATGVSDFAPGATGPPDFLQAVRDRVRGLRPGDVVEGAGYPDQAGPVARVVRGGRVVATARGQPDGQGGWLVVEVAACSGEGLS